MHTDSDTLTARVQDQFGHDHRITLRRQANGQFEEVDDEPQTSAAPVALTAMVEGRFGVEHRIRLVRQPNGEYEEVLEPTDYGQL